jgi:HEAT repeat protein
MAKDKDFLQTIKLEISKNFKLVPYERIAIHKILGIVRSENGINILLREIYKEPLVRASAISILKNIKSEVVTKTLMQLLNEPIGIDEKIDVLEHVERFGDLTNVEDLITFIETNREIDESMPVAERAFDVLRLIGSGSDTVFEYFSRIAMDKGIDERIRSLAIIGLSSFDDVSHYETFLQEDSEEIIFSTYKAISIFCNSFMERFEEERKDDQFYTFQPEIEDMTILEIRVFLGKMTKNFDLYNNRIKTAFINAMISCNHREFIIYTMKALTSEDSSLIKMVLYQLLLNVNRLRDPDKLFRNLIALSVDSEEENRIIVEILERYFNNLVDNRKNSLFRDKLYNYIVVTLETYFETYRKEFMIKDVAEKSFPEDFQEIRHLVLEKFNPEFKKNMINYLRNGDVSEIHKQLERVSARFPYIDEGCRDDLSKFIEILYDRDPKARDISASRLESIKFEKRYLRDRIVRLCEIISRLDIRNAATPLVKIYNYIKKYPDPDILNASSEALSRLNYSYMLGELEVMLNSGDAHEKRRCIELLAQFSEQRTLSIMLDFIKESNEQDSDLIVSILKILVNRDILGNVTANRILKKLIESGDSSEVKRYAILCIGKCGDESDINYLNDLFFSFESSDPKDAVVLAIGYIITYSTNYNKRQLVRNLQEYLKDPGIKVRIYSCSILLLLGDREALKNIQDMMIIKNKNIQREILSIVGNLRSVDFAYFLIALLKEEYAMTNDIVPLLGLLPEEELVEIDHFIVNLFRKYETLDFEESEKVIIRKASDSGLIKNLISKNTNVLVIEILDYRWIIDSFNLSDKIMFLNTVKNASLYEIINNEGIVSMESEGMIVSHFDDPVVAAHVAIKVLRNLEIINSIRYHHDSIKVTIQLMSDMAKIVNGEILRYSDVKYDIINSALLTDRILVDENSKVRIEERFYCEKLPEIIFREFGISDSFYELINPVNFLTIAHDILNRLKKVEQDRQELLRHLDAELKKRKREFRSPSAVAYAKAVDDLSKQLKLELEEVNKYVQKRSTDRELLNNVDKMLSNAYKRFILETSKIIIE